MLQETLGAKARTKGAGDWVLHAGEGGQSRGGSHGSVKKKFGFKTYLGIGALSYFAAVQRALCGLSSATQP